jgi:serralysin
MTKAIANTASTSALIDDLLSTTRWSGESVTFGFTKSGSDYASNYGWGEPTKGYQALSANQMTAMSDAVGAWSELIDLKFVETGGAVADIRIAASTAPVTAWAYTPGNSEEAGDVWVGTSRGYFSNPKDGNYAKMTFIHELGHSLGLGHPHEKKLLTGSGNFVADDGLEGAICPCCAGQVHSSAADLAANYFDGSALGADGTSQAIDAMSYSVMSYSSFAGDGRGGYTNGTWDYAQTPMLRDIAAIQYLYGANYNTRSGDTVYSWDAKTGEKSINGVGQGAPGGNKVFEALWDGGGRDTINLSNYESNLKIDLAPGGWSNFGTSQVANLGAGQTAPGNVALAFLHEGDQRALFENALGGSGNDNIKGNVADNVLLGGAGDDRIEAIDGNNILAGGSIGNELAYLGLDRSAYISFVPATDGDDGFDVLIGGNGNDIFVAGDGTDTVSGNGGLNTLVIDTSLDLLQINGSASSFSVIAGNSKISATGIDFLATQDGIFAIAGSNAGIDAAQAANLRQEISLVYNAGLDRKIDVGGLAYWSKELVDGGSLKDLAAGLINADEFAQLFGKPGDMSDTSFVQVLYNNVLKREGEEAGVNHWVDTLASGTNERADVLVGFSLSDENRSAVASYANAELDTSTTGVDLVAVTQSEWLDIWA